MPSRGGFYFDGHRLSSLFRAAKIGILWLTNYENLLLLCKKYSIPEQIKKPYVGGLIQWL